MSHTLGPWSAQLLRVDKHLINGAGYEISTIAYEVCSWHPTRAPIRKIEDAKLIAASPDLLEALQRAVDCIAPQYIPHGMLEQMQAAIDKATK